MAAKSGASSAATFRRDAREDDQGGDCGFINNSSSSQEWILDAYRALEPGNYLREFTSQNVRPDGRHFAASRSVTVLHSIFARNSHGSAMVTLGGDGGRSLSGGCITRVVAACTLLVGHPSPSTPNDGDIDVTLTASPLSGPRFDVMGRENGEITSGDYGLGITDSDSRHQQLPGHLSNVVTNTRERYGPNTTPSPTDTKEIESWVRRSLRSSRFVNPTELGIETGSSAWRIRISIHIINHEGNVWDAALLCACAALADLRLPAVVIDKGVVRIARDGRGIGDELGGGRDVVGGKEKRRRREGRSLELGSLPAPLTVAIISPGDDGGEGRRKNVETLLLVDPTHLEEDVASGNMATVVCNANGEIVEFHKKGGRSRMLAGQVAALACMGIGRAKELERLVLGR